MRRLSALHRRQRRSVDETHSLHKGEVPIRDFTHMELIAGIVDPGFQTIQ